MLKVITLNKLVAVVALGLIQASQVTAPLSLSSSGELRDRDIRTLQDMEDSKVLLVAQVVSSNPSLEKAEALVGKSLASYGGQEKVLALRNASFEYLVDSEDTPSSKPIKVKTFFKGDSFFRSEASKDNLDAVTILNGDRGWVKVGDTILSLSKKEIDPVKSGMVAQLRPDLLLLYFPKRRYTGRIDEDSRSLDQIEVSGFLGGEYVRGRFSFDVNTGLIYKYEFEIERDFTKGTGIIRGEEKYLRYGEQNGVRFPTEIISKQGRNVSKLTVLRVDFDDILNENLFRDPNPPLVTPKK